jgi:DinB family protein
MTIEQALTLLEETPRRIAAATRSLTEAQLHRAPERGEWSANEVLAHVRACADVRGEPIRAIVAEDHPTFRAVNPRTWIRQTNYLDLEFRSSFRSFAKQRADLLAVLKPLPRKDWSRSATVTGAGAVLERTVLFYAQWVARHERPHVKQIERIVNKSSATTSRPSARRRRTR